ncbi:MAG: hypothetical protein ACLUAM_09580 [Bifidobacterium adolescentis]
MWMMSGFFAALAVGTHVLEGFFGEDLRFVEDDDVDCGEASAEALFAGAEEDAAAVGEGDFLLAVGLADGFAVS